MPDRTIADLLVVARGIWGDHLMTLEEISVALTVVTGDVARQARNLKEGGVVRRADLARELGNLLLSTVRWADGLGLSLGECLAAAEQAQRAYVATHLKQERSDG